MAINLLKRLESSVHSFRKTLEKVKYKIDKTLEDIGHYKSGNHNVEVSEDLSDVEEDDVAYAIEHEIKIEL